MKFMRCSYQQLRLIEELLSASLGDRMILSDGVHNELWEEQKEFQSAVYIHRFRITADKKAWFICKWFDITFFYDKRPDGNGSFIDINRENLDKLQDLINAASEKTESANNLN